MSRGLSSFANSLQRGQAVLVGLRGPRGLRCQTLGRPIPMPVNPTAPRGLRGLRLPGGSQLAGLGGVASVKRPGGGRQKGRLVARSAVSAALLSALLLLGGCAGSQGPSSPSADGANAASAVSPASPAASAAAAYGKSETVYGLLDASGAVEATYVVNRFEVERAGVVEDRGDYASVTPLAGNVPLRYDGSTVEFAADEGVFFYQGTAAASELPWEFSIAYRLNGADVGPDELAGADGLVEMSVAMRANPAVDAAFAESFMVQVTVTLDGARWSAVETSGATLAYAGTDLTYTFTSLPGKDADLWLRGHAEDCAIASIQIAAVAYGQVMELPSMEGAEDELGVLASAIASLDEGSGELAFGAEQLADGLEALAEGNGSAQAGLASLSAGLGSLTQASGEIGSALGAMAQALDGADFSGLESLGQLEDGLRQSASGLRQLAAASAQAASGNAQALAAMDGAMASLDPSAATPEAVAALLANPGLSDQERATVEALASTARAAAALQGTWEAVRPGIAGANSLLQALGADGSTPGSLESIASGLEAAADGLAASADPEAVASLRTLAEGLLALSASYDDFHGGLLAASQGLGSLVAGNEKLAAGSQSMAQGGASLAQGAGRLSDGIGQLADETSDLPRLMRSRIDEAMADYEFPAFDGTSFASGDNGPVDAVQFVLSAEPVSPKPEPKPDPEPEPEPTLWERFLALFG